MQYNLRNVEQVKCIHCAVAECEKGKVKFYEAPDSSFGMGSLAPQFSGEFIEVDTTTLDRCVPKLTSERVAVIKVDVEGFEWGVFKGAEFLLRRDKPTVIFEFLDWAESRAGFETGAAQQLLLDQGYTLSVFERSEKKIQTPQKSGAAMIVARHRDMSP